MNDNTRAEEELKNAAPPPRSESDVVGQRAAKVELGGKAYDLRVKSINKSNEWKEKFINLIKPVFSSMEVQPDDPESFSDALQMLLFRFPQVVLELVCAWSDDIDKDVEQIKEEASEQEVIAAFMVVLGLAFPFSFVLGLAKSLMTSLQASERSTSSSSQSTG